MNPLNRKEKGIIIEIAVLAATAIPVWAGIAYWHDPLLRAILNNLMIPFFKFLALVGGVPTS